MKFLALVSGGKDSHYNIIHCLKNGHELTVMANLRPLDLNEQELDSFMFQTCGHDLIEKYPLVTSVPIEFGSIKADTSLVTTLTYDKEEKFGKDEIEELFDLLKKCSEKYDFEAVSVGAILSSYQRNRVEDCCNRLGLKVLSYLWQRNQSDLMNEMCLVSKTDYENDSDAYKLDARIIKTAAIGLNKTDLGKSLPEIKDKMEKLNKLYDVHICGEGGEFETLVLDSPIFDKGYFKLKTINIENNNDNKDDVYSCTFDVEIVPRTEKTKSLFALSDYLKSVVSPTLFDSKWTALKEKLLNNISAFEYKKELVKLNENVKLPLTVCKLGDILHIQNIQPKTYTASMDNQCGEVFKQLFDILRAYNISKKQILTTTLCLKDMANFSKINQNYMRFFSNVGSLPPSRACLGNKLIPGDLQLSCCLTLEEKNPVIKDGIHVQGISYWNPCNIGPYSQVIYPWNQRNKIGYMAGQIPLVPNTMKLYQCLEDDINKFWIENSVIALRHYDHLKNLINLKENLSTIWYLSNEKIKNDASMNSAISAAVNVWTAYTDVSVDEKNWDEEEEEEIKTRFAYECETFDHKQNVNNIVICVVDELPAGAPLEIGGVVCANKDTRDLDQFESDDENSKSVQVILEKGINVLNNEISYNYKIEFFNSCEEFLEFLSKSDAFPFQGTVYFNHTSLNKNAEYLKDFSSYENLEYFPVRRLFDYTGKEYDVAFSLKTILI
ncbi:hypothetical protein QEN19_001869 [Hanseniaspora menglaensis]